MANLVKKLQIFFEKMAELVQKIENWTKLSAYLVKPKMGNLVKQMQICLKKLQICF